MRIRCSSLSNKKLANDFDSSVLPTPVGPKNKKDPYGFPSSLKPDLDRLMAFEIDLTASS